MARFSRTIGICALLAACNAAQGQHHVRHIPQPPNSGQDSNAALPQANAPQANGPQTSVPQSNVLRTNAPQSGVPQSNVPQTNAPQSQSNVPQPNSPGALSSAPAVQQQPATTTPAVPPVVTYRDGLLTVQAMNSNLSAVIAAIRSKTGIEFEGAEGASERVAISLGPATEGEVLSAIFSGSRFDFMAIGRPDSPAIVQRVILTPRDKSGNTAEARTQPNPPARQQGEEEETNEDQLNAGDPQDTAVQPIPVPEQTPQSQNQQQQPKSPEQLLQELQQMRRLKGSPPDDPNGNVAPRKPPR